MKVHTIASSLISSAIFGEGGQRLGQGRCHRTNRRDFQLSEGWGSLLWGLTSSDGWHVTPKVTLETKTSRQLCEHWKHDVFRLCMNNISVRTSPGRACQVFLFLSAVVFIFKPFLTRKFFLCCSGPSRNGGLWHTLCIHWVESFLSL